MFWNKKYSSAESVSALRTKQKTVSGVDDISCCFCSFYLKQMKVFFIENKLMIFIGNKLMSSDVKLKHKENWESLGCEKVT